MRGSLLLKVIQLVLGIFLYMAVLSLLFFLPILLSNKNSMQRLRRSASNSQALNVLFVLFAGAICAALVLYPNRTSPLGPNLPTGLAAPITRQRNGLEEQVTVSPQLSGFVNKVSRPVVARSRVWPSTCITYVVRLLPRLPQAI